VQAHLFAAKMHNGKNILHPTATVFKQHSANRQKSRFCGYWQNLMHLTTKKICTLCLFYSFIFYISSVGTKPNRFSVPWKGKQYFFLRHSTAIKFFSILLHQIHIPKPYLKIHHNHNQHHHELFS